MAETDWAAQQEAIRLAVAKAMRLPDQGTIGGTRLYKRVEWAGRETADRWAQGVVVELRLGAVVPTGQLERRDEYDAGTDRLVSTYGRYERFTVSVAVESDNQTPGATAAGTLAGRLRTRIQRPDVHDVYAAAGVSFVNQATTFEGDYEADGRMLSASYQDLFFSHVAWDRDEPEDSNDWFHEVRGAGEPDLTPVTLQAGPPDEV